MVTFFNYYFAITCIQDYIIAFITGGRYSFTGGRYSCTGGRYPALVAGTFTGGRYSFTGGGYFLHWWLVFLHWWRIFLLWWWLFLHWWRVFIPSLVAGIPSLVVGIPSLVAGILHTAQPIVPMYWLSCTVYFPIRNSGCYVFIHCFGV